MADIHIGKISQSSSVKFKAHLIYHIPLSAPKVVIVPTSESSISSQLDHSEIEALSVVTLL